MNDKEIYLIGNGPSLQNVNIGTLRGKNTISFNRAYISYEDWKFEPSYYMIIDSALISSTYKDINNLVKNSDIKKFFIKENEFITPNEKVKFLKTGGGNGVFKRGWEESKYPISHFGSVGLCSLQLLYKMEYTKVYLLGCDMNYTLEIDADKEKGILESNSDTDPNHYRPDYFGKGIKYGNPAEGIIMNKWERAMDKINKLDNFEVISLTENSKLNEFVPFDYNKMKILKR